MKIVEKAFEGFNSVNRMGMQMMKNMMGRSDQASPFNGFENISFQGVPGLKKVQEGMKTLSEKAAEKLPPLGKLGDVQGSAQDLAKNMLPAMRDQMAQMMQGMQEMNRIALDTMQSVFDANSKMMAQVFDAVKAPDADEKATAPAAGPAAPAEAEKPAEPARAAKPAAEKKAPAKKAPAKTEKPAAAEKKAPAKTEKPAAEKKTPARKSKTAAPAAPAAEEKKEEKAEA